MAATVAPAIFGLIRWHGRNHSSNKQKASKIEQKYG